MAIGEIHSHDAGLPVGQVPVSERVAAAVPPRGWEPIRDLCTRVAEKFDVLVDQVVASIYDDIPSYMSVDVERSELVASVYGNTSLMLAGIAERRGPHPAEVRERGAMGRRRARQGVPAEDVIQAFHIGYRELWNALVNEAAGCGPRTSGLLLSAATTAWSWTHLITGAVADAHKEVTRTRQSLIVRASQRLLDLIVFGDTESDETMELARSLSLRPAGGFQAILLRTAPDDARRIRDELAYAPGAHLAAVFQGGVLIVRQQGSEAAAERVVRRLLPDVPMGVGLERPGLAGARLSIGDAERALAAVAGSPTVRFADEWFRAIVVGAQDRLGALLAPGLQAAARHGHLVAAIREYIDCGFSQQQAALRLSIHANTVAYRVGRWETLTGWKVGTTRGLLLTLASLELSGGLRNPQDRGRDLDGSPEYDAIGGVLG